jgi:signal transduction histidine kinase
VAQIKAGERDAMVRFLDERGGGAILAVVADEGPCSLYHASWSAPEGARAGLGLLVLLLIAGLAILAGFVALTLVTRPTIRRLRDVAGAATRVGVEGETLSYPLQRGDEIDVVGQALQQAHQRILTDRATLVGRQRALESHLSNIAHDLKTPLTSLFMSLEGILNASGDADEVREKASGALSDALYLASLTDNLYLDTRFEQSLETPPEALTDRVELNDLLQRVARRYRLVGQKRGVMVEVVHPDEPVAISGNQTLVEQALSNVVQNATMYTDPGESALVTLVLTTDGDSFTLTVTDDGPGVPAEQLPLLATRHFRGDEARRRTPIGAGLGLAITRRICEIHGLALSFSLPEDGGLRVTISGPVA